MFSISTNNVYCTLNQFLAVTTMDHCVSTNWHLATVAYLKISISMDYWYENMSKEYLYIKHHSLLFGLTVAEVLDIWIMLHHHEMYSEVEPVLQKYRMG